jgi:Ni/Co efflux regulator RcnB
MAHSVTGLTLATALLLTAAAAGAQERDHGGDRGEAHPPAEHAAPEHRPAAEPHPGPSHYQRLNEPKGWNDRPQQVDRGAYQHNFQAQRSFHVGPYHRPHGWVDRRWVYGDHLPRAFWASPYILADYWLFALETPPVGYEWVRYGNDALLIDINSGEVLQAEYGVFA